jgi:hypothetical protein
VGEDDRDMVISHDSVDCAPVLRCGLSCQPGLFSLARELDGDICLQHV